MYLSLLEVENFRVFGSGDKAISVCFQSGLNALIVENDSGKTAIIDAIRHCLGTTSNDFVFLAEEDFHISQGSRASEIRISCKFEGLSELVASRLVEWLSVENDAPVLYVTLIAKRNEDTKIKRRKISYTVKTNFRWERTLCSIE